MASNPRPTTRTTITYGRLGAAESTSALMPVFIAPRYAIHAHEEGYEDAFLCEYDAVKNADAASLTWPALRGSVASVDVEGAKLIAENAVLAVNTTAITGISIDETAKNKLIFTTPVCDGNGYTRNPLLGDYDVRIGDYIYDKSADEPLIITDIQAEDKAAAIAVTVMGGVGVAPTVSSYTGSANLVYLVEVVQLLTAEDAVTGLVARCTGLSGDNYTEQVVCTLGTATRFGNFDLEITFAEGTYEVGYAVKVVATPAGKGAFNIVYVNSENASVSEVTFATSNLSDDTIELGDASWTVSTGGVITLADTINTTVANEVRRIFKADMYVEYRELVSDNAMTLVSCNADAVKDFVGLADKRNPLGLMYSNARNIDGANFYLMSVSADTDDATIAAVNVAAKYEAAYAPVTYRQTAAVAETIDRVIKKYSDPLIAQFKVTWRTPLTSREQTVLPAEGAILGRIKDGVVSFENGVDLVEAGVRVGDVLYVYGAYNAEKQEYRDFEYDIIGINDSSTLVVAGAADINSWTKVVIKRVLTNAAYAKALADEAKQLNNHRVRLVWADRVNMYGEQNVELVYLVAQLAALRSSLPPHAPLSDVAVPGATITDTLKFTDDEYDIMNAGGVWVVANDNDGIAVTQHQITTKTDGTLAEEESAVSNGDSMVREFRVGMKKYKGSSNIYQALLPQIQADLEKIADNIIGREYKAIYGPQLLSFKVAQLYIPESNNAKVICKNKLETPKPLLASEFEYNLF